MMRRKLTEAEEERICLQVLGSSWRATCWVVAYFMLFLASLPLMWLWSATWINLPGVSPPTEEDRIAGCCFTGGLILGYLVFLVLDPMLPFSFPWRIPLAFGLPFLGSCVLGSWVWATGLKIDDARKRFLLDVADNEEVTG